MCGCNVPAVQLIYRFSSDEIRSYKAKITQAIQRDGSNRAKTGTSNKMAGEHSSGPAAKRATEWDTLNLRARPQTIFHNRSIILSSFFCLSLCLS